MMNNRKVITRSSSVRDLTVIHNGSKERSGPVRKNSKREHSTGKNNGQDSKRRKLEKKNEVLQPGKRSVKNKTSIEKQFKKAAANARRNAISSLHIDIQTGSSSEVEEEEEQTITDVINEKEKNSREPIKISKTALYEEEGGGKQCENELENSNEQRNVNEHQDEDLIDDPESYHTDSPDSENRIKRKLFEPTHCENDLNAEVDLAEDEYDIGGDDCDIVEDENEDDNVNIKESSRGKRSEEKNHYGIHTGEEKGTNECGKMKGKLMFTTKRLIWVKMSRIE